MTTSAIIRTGRRHRASGVRVRPFRRHSPCSVARRRDRFDFPYVIINRSPVGPQARLPALAAARAGAGVHAGPVHPDRPYLPGGGIAETQAALGAAQYDRTTRMTEPPSAAGSRNPSGSAGVPGMAPEGGELSGPARRARAGAPRSAGSAMSARAFALALTLAAALASSLAAQQREGDEAWEQGRLDEAEAAYERVLAKDSTAFRANLRTGLMLGWRGKHDSALARIARARRSEPKDVEARLIEARVRAWDRMFDEAIARYDSMLVEQPGLAEAELGRARVRGWRGDLAGAERGFRAVLAAEPRNPDALAGLGYVYHWQGRDNPAGRMASAALAADSTNQAGRELRQAVRAATRAIDRAVRQLEQRLGPEHQLLADPRRLRTPRAGVRAFGNVGLLEASDPARDATRIGGEAGLSWAIGGLQLSAPPAPAGLGRTRRPAHRRDLSRAARLAAGPAVRRERRVRAAIHSTRSRR